MRLKGTCRGRRPQLCRRTFMPYPFLPCPLKQYALNRKTKYGGARYTKICLKLRRTAKKKADFANLPCLSESVLRSGFKNSCLTYITCVDQAQEQQPEKHPIVLEVYRVYYKQTWMEKERSSYGTRCRVACFEVSATHSRHEVSLGHSSRDDCSPVGRTHLCNAASKTISEARTEMRWNTTTGQVAIASLEILVISG